MTTRRTFLKSCAAAAPALALGRFAFAGLHTGAPRCLVVVRLGGGNDGLNTVAPVEDDVYRRLRPSLALTKAESLSLGRHGLALHPRLKGLAEHFDAGRLAVVTNVGYPRPDRSHFRSMDIWHTASLEPERARVGVHGATLATLARETSASGIPGVALLDTEMPLGLVHPDVPVPLLASLEQVRLDEAKLVPLLELGRDAPASSPLARAVGAAHAATRLARRLEHVDLAATANAFPATALGKRLATLFTLLRSGLDLRIAYVAHDGFDTHTRQKDNHAALLLELGDALAAFQTALVNERLDRDVVTLTFSEFGRRVEENGSKGTDHGAAAPLFVLGSSVTGGVFGEAPDLTALEDGDVRYTTDFRQVYATLLERWFGVDSRPVLGGSFAPLPFLPAMV